MRERHLSEIERLEEYRASGTLSRNHVGIGGRWTGGNKRAFPAEKSVAALQAEKQRSES